MWCSWWKNFITNSHKSNLFICFDELIMIAMCIIKVIQLTLEHIQLIAHTHLIHNNEILLLLFFSRPPLLTSGDQGAGAPLSPSRWPLTIRGASARVLGAVSWSLRTGPRPPRHKPIVSTQRNRGITRTARGIISLLRRKYWTSDTMPYRLNKK